MSAPRASVVVPVHDRRLLLARTLAGLQEQTLTDFEVVVVDDGSTDGSAEEARALEGQLPITVVTTPGEGAVKARIAGVRAARGEVLAFTDSDCVPQPKWLAAGLAELETGKGVVQGLTRPTRTPGPLERTVVSDRPDGLFATCNVFYRRDAFEAAGGFDAAAAGRLRFRMGRRAQLLGFGEDTLLAWRVARVAGWGFASDAVVEHHVFPPDLRESISRSAMAGAFPALVREVPELRGTLLQNGVFLGTSRVGLYGAIAALLLRRPGVAGAGLAAWIVANGRGVARSTTVQRAATVLGARLVLDATTAAALIAGSIRARTPVL